MKKIFILLAIIFISCEKNKEIHPTHHVNWGNRTANINANDSLKTGTTYLSVYPQIYSTTQYRTHSLTATISMRNINLKDTIYIEKANYYNQKGKLIRSYFNNPIFLAPLETIDIVIEEDDNEGGTGANFIFNWKIKQNTNNPFFEAVMISTSGQQGLSFTTKGVEIN